MEKKLNVELLEQIIQQIEAQPEHFNMESWVNHCGTTGCIAGWAVCIDAFNADPNKGLKEMSVLYHSDQGFDIEGKARRLLGVGASCGGKLFFTDQWPQPFRDEYEYAEKYDDHGNLIGQKEQAAITVRRIRHFIKTGE